MRKLGMVALVSAGLISLCSVIGCSPFYASGSWRYRMTVEIETPEGIKTGTAVREVSIQDGFKLPESHAATRVKGEAVAVDLGKRGVVFAIMRGNVGGIDYGYQITYDAFPTYAFPSEPAEQTGTISSIIRRFNRLMEEHANTKLELRQYPDFVAFSNIKDPKSVQLAYAMEEYEVRNEQNRLEKHSRVQADNMEKLFGKGVRIKSVTIEMTEDKVTTGIEKWMPPFGAETGFMQWFTSLPYGDPLKIGPNYFKLGAN